MSQEFVQSITQYLPLILILIVFVVLIIIPQRKRDKKAKEMLNSMKVGSRVKTIGGIYGTIVTLKEDLITIETGPEKTKIVFARGAIATVDNGELEVDAEIKEAKV